MARVNYNVVTHGISGKIGDLLQFRQRNGKTIVAKIAARSGRVTPDQQQVREKFRLAAIYAGSALKNPVMRELYESRATAGQSAYNLAIRDYFNAPLINSVDLGSYTGEIGSMITVVATDDTRLVDVRVQVFDNTGSLVEAGSAIRVGDQDSWIYTATVFHNSPAGGKVVVEVQDTPGNITVQEYLL